MFQLQPGVPSSDIFCTSYAPSSQSFAATQTQMQIKLEHRRGHDSWHALYYEPKRTNNLFVASDRSYLHIAKFQSYFLTSVVPKSQENRSHTTLFGKLQNLWSKTRPKPRFYIEHPSHTTSNYFLENSVKPRPGSFKVHMLINVAFTTRFVCLG